jgi:hypothetical protein
VVDEPQQFVFDFVAGEELVGLFDVQAVFDKLVADEGLRGGER